MKVVNFNAFVRLACFALIVIFVGCSTSTNSDFANLNGTWQNPSNKLTVVLNITGDNKTITIGDKTLPITIKQVRQEKFIVHVSDKTLGEKDWSLLRVWDDNGSSFTIKLERDGTVDNLAQIV